MEFKSDIDWSKIPREVPGQGHRRDLAKYESLDQGRIAMPIPHRVQSGSAGPGGLILETYDDVYRVEWSQVEFLALGLMLNQVGPDKTPKSGMRMKIRELLLGDPEKKIKAKSTSEFHILDIYLCNQEAPYRLDQGTTNYRGFLMRPGYVSIDNFRQVVKRIAYFSANAHFNGHLVDFINCPRNRLESYENIHDFQLESRIARHNPDGQIHREKVKIAPPDDPNPAPVQSPLED